MKTALLMTLAAIGLCTGCTTTHLHRSVSDNPLPAMASFAQKNDYRIMESGTDHLKVRKNINWGMLFLGSRDRFVGEYHYTPGNLNAEVYLSQTSLWGLGITTTMELRPQFIGSAVTPSARRCSDEMLKAGGMKPEWQ